MKRLLAILLLLCAARSYGAAGDVISSFVEANGYVLNVILALEGTNGTYNFGLLTNNTGTPAMRVDMTSEGYDDTGTLTTLHRVIYGTRILRLAYPNNALNDVTASSAVNCQIRIVLSDFVYAGDSNLTMTASANWYSNNVAAVTAYTTTNSSAVAYPKCVANWSWPGWQRVTGNSMTLRAVGFHRSGQNGRPLRVMKFTAQDQHSHTVTSYITSMLIDASVGDAVPVCEYIANINTSTMTQGDLIRCDFTAYPWVGDAGAILSTTDNVNAMPCGNYASITNVCDNALTYGLAYAVVSVTNNSGSAGAVAQTFNSGSPPLAFDTIAHAYSAMVASNNTWYSRNDAGAGTIYLREGNHNWVGTGSPSGTVPNTWVNYTAFPGALRTNIWIGGQSGNNICEGREHLTNLWISNSAAILIYSTTASHSLWIDNDDLNLAGADAFDVRAWFVTGCNIFNLHQGFSSPTGDNAVDALVRGNTIYGLGVNNTLYTVIGNYRPTPQIDEPGDFMSDAVAGKVPNAATCPIFAYNKIMSHNDNFMLDYQNISNAWFGAAIVQNVMEQATNQAGSYIGSVMEYDNNAATNLISWNNTWVGQRWNYAYDSSSTVYMLQFSLKNNLADSMANKSDTFSPGGASRTNNWPVVFGVGSSGNFVVGLSNTTASFPFEFMLNSYQPAVGVFNPATNYPAYVGRAAYDGASSGAGNGNYRVQTQSPTLVNLPTSWLLPFDVEGQARGLSDPPGAYASASPRKSGMFFGN